MCAFEQDEELDDRGQRAKCDVDPEADVQGDREPGPGRGSTVDATAGQDCSGGEQEAGEEEALCRMRK